MTKVFDNPLNINRFTLLYRALNIDPMVEIRTFDATSDVENPDSPIIHIVEIESTVITDAQIMNTLAIPPTEAEVIAYSFFVSSRMDMKSIPNWSLWSATEALNWATENIGTPLATGRSSLPATLTLASTRTAILSLLTIMDKMYTLQVSLIQMIIALRNKTFI